MYYNVMGTRKYCLKDTNIKFKKFVDFPCSWEFMPKGIPCHKAYLVAGTKGYALR
jgi:hypothetical protein